MLNLNVLSKYKEFHILYSKEIFDNQKIIGFSLLDKEDNATGGITYNQRDIEVILEACREANIPIIDETQCDSDKMAPEKSSVNALAF